MGKCPWCRREISWIGYSFKEVEWEKCRTPRCKGNFLTLVTDWDGFVIHPYRIRDKYIY